MVEKADLSFCPKGCPNSDACVVGFPCSRSPLANLIRESLEARGADDDDWALPDFRSICEHTGAPVDKCICQEHDPDGKHFQEALRGQA